MFKVEAFVSVGIGPLTHWDEYVQPGPPMEHLRGDMKKLAQRMQVTCPPLESRTAREYQIQNLFFLGTPSTTLPNFKALAKLFKEKHNGVDIFPKLPSQLQTSFQQWKQTNLIKVGMRKMKEAYETLLHRLTLRRVLGANIPFRREEIHAFTDPDANRNEWALQQFVPPLAAPMQAEPLNETGRLVVAKSSRSCAWAPLCKGPAEVCKGYKRGDCIRAGVEFDIPSDGVDAAWFENKRLESRRAKKRQQEAMRREKKKAARNIPVV